LSPELGTGNNIEDHSAEIQAVMLPAGGVTEDGEIYRDSATGFNGFALAMLAMHSYLYDACLQGAIADPDVTHDQVWDAVRDRVINYGKGPAAAD
jgi:hypothetical protein